MPQSPPERVTKCHWRKVCLGSFPGPGASAIQLWVSGRRWSLGDIVEMKKKSIRFYNVHVKSSMQYHQLSLHLWKAAHESAIAQINLYALLKHHTQH